MFTLAVTLNVFVLSYFLHSGVIVFFTFTVYMQHNKRKIAEVKRFVDWDFIFQVAVVLAVIALAFEGILGRDNPDVTNMKGDVLYGEIPGIGDDKENLRNDSKNLVKDLNTAYTEYRISRSG